MAEAQNAIQVVITSGKEEVGKLVAEHREEMLKLDKERKMECDGNREEARRLQAMVENQAQTFNKMVGEHHGEKEKLFQRQSELEELLKKNKNEHRAEALAKAKEIRDLRKQLQASGRRVD